MPGQCPENLTPYDVLDQPESRLALSTRSPASVVEIARPLGASAPHLTAPADGATDRLAVLSAICGMTAFVPVVSQLAGLALGVISLRRIRRARRNGIKLPGHGWALIGVISSSLTLLGWIAFLAVMAFVSDLLAQSSGSLNALTRLSGR
ncbi:MAG: hypothetical protein KJ749_01240 [Planctomycetes bacterium]|nr:hypothetical protein [Planctomycetota bacterium]